MVDSIKKDIESSLQSNTPLLCVIAGPSAVGKTSLTIELAKQYSLPVISADSRQIYKEMSVGTAKPTIEEMNGVPHYFIGSISIQDYYSISRFENEVLSLLPNLFKIHKTVILSGGSGLYIDAICRGIDPFPDPNMEIRENVIALFKEEGITGLRRELKKVDPEFYENSDIANHKRIIRALEVFRQTGIPYSQQLTAEKKHRGFSTVKYCLTRPRKELNERINKRVDIMIENGLLNEAKCLYQYKYLNALNTVGYKELFDYLESKLTLEKAIEDIKTHTRRYAKRQMTWFKRDKEYNFIDLCPTTQLASF